MDALFEELQSMTQRRQASCKYGKQLAAAMERLSASTNPGAATQQELERVDSLVQRRAALRSARQQRDLLQVEHVQAVEDRENLKTMFKKLCLHVEQTRRSSINSGTFSSEIDDTKVCCNYTA